MLGIIFASAREIVRYVSIVCMIGGGTMIAKENKKLSRQNEHLKTELNAKISEPEVAIADTIYKTDTVIKVDVDTFDRIVYKLKIRDTCLKLSTKIVSDGNPYASGDSIEQPIKSTNGNVSINPILKTPKAHAGPIHIR